MELFDFVGSSTIDTLSEDDLLASIKRLAVKGKNVAVHRQEFNDMQQAPGQAVQHFVAKLKAKAEQCHFRLKCSSSQCNHEVNSYATAMVANQLLLLTVGLTDKDIQGEVLAKHSQLKTFEEKFDLIQALEDGKQAKKLKQTSIVMLDLALLKQFLQAHQHCGAQGW